MTESSKSKPCRFAGLLGWFLPASILGLFFTWLLTPIFINLRNSQDVRRAQFASPTNPANEIWFYDGGFRERDMFLCAKCKGQKARRVAQLTETGEYRFSCGQWTKDGQVFICSLKGKAIGNAPVMAIGYDFSTGEITVPPWLHFFAETNETNWHEFEPTVQKLVAAHGGLSDQRMDDDMVRENEKTLWFWQTIP